MENTLDEPAPAAAPAVGGQFRLFYDHFGERLCGEPLTDVFVEDGRPTQIFRRIALVEAEPGRVLPVDLGARWLAAQEKLEETESVAPPAPVTDISARLARHPTAAYPSRTLSDIRHVVIHHTRAILTPDEIADEHVRVNGWPGIGYHFVVTRTGEIFQTQDLTTVSFHARQFNPAAVGIALVGDYGSDVPPPGQLDGTAAALAHVLDQLGLPTASIRGHREIVATDCPGDTFLSLWKPRLVRLVELQVLAAKRVRETALA